MKFNLFLLTILSSAFLGIISVEAQKKNTDPILKVGCNALAANITLTYHQTNGNKTVTLTSAPVKLKKGERYTLSITKADYLPYSKTFVVDWEGQKQKFVYLEKGIGPSTSRSWMVDLGDNVDMEFVPIPVGSFMMGSEEGEDDELPIHKVSFSRPFWMAKTEVTQQQFEQYKLINHKKEKNEVLMPIGAEYPAVWISWDDAMGFCAWLTRLGQREGTLPEGYEYTLPTEAEWEYACRAGTTGEFAGKLDSMGWYIKNSTERINPVGKKKPNAWGLYDMHGNVWEWCYDNWYANYENAPSDGSIRGLAKNEFYVDRTLMGKKGSVRFVNDSYKVVRGGCWHYSARSCRSANRFYHEKSYKMNYLGFRPILISNPIVLRPQVTDKIRRKR